MTALAGPLAAMIERGQFSGHETFPFRYGWLTKAVQALRIAGKRERSSVFDPDNAIADFGVGRNMVASMRHWVIATGMVDSSQLSVTELGEAIFGSKALDPYLELPGTLWLLHWKIASKPRPATTWYWAFNHHPSSVFDREWLAADLLSLCRERQWRRTAPTTLKRDVDCLIRTYVVSGGKDGGLKDDSLECPLAELELIVPGSERGSYQFQRGPKPTLPDSVLALALADYWNTYRHSDTVSLERLAYDPGSPGRVFKIDETSLAERLVDIEKISNGDFRWIDTAGLRQVQRLDETVSEAQYVEQALVSVAA